MEGGKELEKLPSPGESLEVFMESAQQAGGGVIKVKQGEFLRGALNTRQGDKLIGKQFANCWLGV